MKTKKLIIAGLTAAMMFGGATAVFADEIAEPEGAQGRPEMEQIAMGRPEMEQIDMSGLELPEGFVPFDEEHVPDGLNAPKNGELKPIEFDEEGNMIFGQKPEGMPGEMDGRFPGRPPMEGERPELPDGEMPAFDGERPELPEGEMPAFNGGQPASFGGNFGGGQAQGQMTAFGR